jgi:hypothetical protein
MYLPPFLQLIAMFVSNGLTNNDDWQEMQGKSNRATSCDDEKLEHAAAAQVEEPDASETTYE